MKFVKNANLPICASGVIVSSSTPDSVLDALHLLNINTFFSPEIEILGSLIGTHADIGILHINSNNFVCAPETAEYYKTLFWGKNANIICGKNNLGGKYPQDVAYNIAQVGNNIFLNTKYADEVAFSKLNGKIIDIKQGYAKCSICIVDENSIITEDDGIEKAALDNNIEVLKISKGQVELKGFDFGFIGGASGKLRSDILAFAGDISKHSDYKKILSFCNERGVDVISLGDDKLTDIGSILPVFEKE